MNPRNDAALLHHSAICECDECWNAGARWADAHWADDPQPTWEMSPSGELYETANRYHNPNAIYARKKEANDNRGKGE